MTVAVARAMATTACSGSACRRLDAVESNADADVELPGGAEAAAKLTPSAAAVAPKEAASPAMRVCEGAAACIPCTQSGSARWLQCKHSHEAAKRTRNCGRMLSCSRMHIMLYSRPGGCSLSRAYHGRVWKLHSPDGQRRRCWARLQLLPLRCALGCPALTVRLHICGSRGRRNRCCIQRSMPRCGRRCMDRKWTRRRRRRRMQRTPARRRRWRGCVDDLHNDAGGRRRRGCVNHLHNDMAGRRRRGRVLDLHNVAGRRRRGGVHDFHDDVRGWRRMRLRSRSSRCLPLRGALAGVWASAGRRAGDAGRRRTRARARG